MTNKSVNSAHRVDEDDNQSVMSKGSVRSKAQAGVGTWHCLHKECFGRNPVKSKKDHRPKIKHSQPMFAPCTGDNCVHCGSRKGKSLYT